jgi:hypothetical protein
LLALPPLGPGHHYVDLAAAALGTDKPLSPIGNGGLGAVALGHFGGGWLDLVAARLAPHNQRCETGESTPRADELSLSGDYGGAAT